MIHLTEAPPYQDEAPPSPVAVDPPVMSEALVEEFTYAYTSTAAVTPARPANIEATEPRYAEPSYAEVAEPSYAELAEPLHNMAGEPSGVEATKSSYVDDAWNTATPIVETMSDADQLTAPEPDRQAPGYERVIRSGPRGDPGGLGQARSVCNGAILGPGSQATHRFTGRGGLDQRHRGAGRRRPLDSPREASGGQPEDAAREGSRPEDGGD